MSGPEILVGDARALPLPDESVDLVVTSPPYFGLRDYGVPGQLGAEPTPAEFIAALVECTREVVRVLKPSGSIFVNLGDKYSGAGRGNNTGSALTNPQDMRERRLAGSNRRQHLGKGIIPAKSLMMLPERYRIAAVDELGLIARAVIVWSKPNGLPESVTDRVRRSHEDWVHLTKSPRYFASVDEIREPHVDVASVGRARQGAKHTPRQNDGGGAAGNSASHNPLGKLPGSVWTIPTQPLRVPAELGVDHFAAFPMEWPRRIIRGWSPEGGVVLDPFGGTGTTAIVACALGRRGISIDLNPDYKRLAEWRAQDPKQRAKAEGSPCVGCQWSTRCRWCRRPSAGLSSDGAQVCGRGVPVGDAGDGAAGVGDVPELVAGGVERSGDHASAAVGNDGVDRVVVADVQVVAHARTVARPTRATQEGVA